MSKEGGRGFGLVRRGRLLSDGPMSICVGDVTFTITRLGDLTATVGVKAPPNMAITFVDGAPLHETVEAAIQSVVEGEPDDNA